MNPLSIAQQALSRGFDPIPLMPGTKRPFTRGWTTRKYEDNDALVEHFTAAGAKWEEPMNVGLALGPNHGGLVDIDLDNPRAVMLAERLLPHTAMRSGRSDSPSSHFWYRLSDPNFDHGTKQFSLPDGSVIIEFRYTDSQTVAPGSIHPTGDTYRWEGEPWGGDEGPAVVEGRKLLASVALIAMLVTLADNWPGPGSRHGAYLAFTGGMLRDADEEGRPRCHPGWDQGIESVIRVLADLTHDKDGAATRITETVESTRRKIVLGKKVQGWPTLAEMIGEDYVQRVRDAVRLIEDLDGRPRSRVTSSPDSPQKAAQSLSQGPSEPIVDERMTELADVPLSERNPLAERSSSWEAIDIAPYLLGDLEPTQPTMLRRDDGKALLYPGKINSLYGPGGSGKTWIALHTAMEVMNDGGSVLLIDFEDEPQGTLSRLRAMHADEAAMLEGRFAYVAPDDAIASMQTDRYGHSAPTVNGAANKSVFTDLLNRMDPTLIIVDGLTTLYSLHGLNPNDAAGTDILSRWLRSLTGGYRRTVLMIDHTSKSASAGSGPSGSQHKVSMITGSALQVVTVTRPRIGIDGQVLLYVGKDRPGQVLSVSSPEDPAVCAEVNFRSKAVDEMRLEILPLTSEVLTVDNTTPEKPKRTGPTKTQLEAQRRAVQVEQEILHLLGGKASMSMKEINLGIHSGGRDKLHGVMRSLIERGEVRQLGEGRSTAYSLNRPGVGDPSDSD